MCWQTSPSRAAPSISCGESSGPAGRRDLNTDARLVPWHHRIGKTDDVDALLQHSRRKSARQGRVVEHHRYDRRFTGQDVEAGGARRATPPADRGESAGGATMPSPTGRVLCAARGRRCETRQRVRRNPSGGCSYGVWTPGLTPIA